MSKETGKRQFSELALNKANELGLGSKHTCAKHIGISPARWMQIANDKIPSFSGLSAKAISGWVQSITRVCDALGLDLESSLEMLGLPAEPVAIKLARDFRTGHIEIGLPEIEKLRQLVELVGKPITLAFAESFLRRTLLDE